MNNNQLNGLSPVWLIGLALCLGVFLVTAIPLVVSVNVINSTAWIGFAGSLVGGAIAIIGLFIASNNVRRQLRINLMGREEERMEIELPSLKQLSEFLKEMTFLTGGFSPGSISKILDARLPPNETKDWMSRLRKKLPDADTRSVQQIAVIIGQLYREDYTLEGLSEHWRIIHDRVLREREAGVNGAEIEASSRIAADRMNEGVTKVQRKIGDLRKYRDEVNRRINLYEERLPRFRKEIEAFFET